jgi:hypothetical protein
VSSSENLSLEQNSCYLRENETDGVADMDVPRTRQNANKEHETLEKGIAVSHITNRRPSTGHSINGRQVYSKANVLSMSCLDKGSGGRITHGATYAKKGSARVYERGKYPDS